MRFRILRYGGLAAAIVLLACGCSSMSRSSYSAPPARGTAASSAEAGRPVVVIGPFVSRVRSKAAGRSLGMDMSDALADALLDKGDVEVWIDPTLGQRVARLVDLPAAKRERELVELRTTHPDVAFVITGTITDFMHTQSIATEVRRKKLFGGIPNEAVVAFRMNLIDLHEGRVIVTDHIHGLAKAPDVSEKELYANVTFGSYLFWSTPLGKASRDALDKAVDEVGHIVPKLDRTIRVAKKPDATTQDADESEPAIRVAEKPESTIFIVEQTGPREIRISTADVKSLETGLAYHICVINPQTGEHEMVIDPDTGTPVMARVSKNAWSNPVATLRGRKPVDVDLRGAVLCNDASEVMETRAEAG